MNQTECVLGQKYVIMITGVIRKVIAECVEVKDDRYGMPRLKVLNRGTFHNVVLKDGDYILCEVYDPEKHGEIET